MSWRERVFGEPPWSSPEAALAFVDPRLADAFSVELIQDLLRVAAGESVSTQRTLNDAQFGLLMEHRAVPLIPDSWILPEARLGVKRKLAFWSMELEAASIESIDLLRHAGIEPLALKGMATSHLDYAQPELRHSGDLDVLVDEKERLPAISLLEQNGYVPTTARQFDPEFEKGYGLASPDGVEVDVHSRLCHTAKNCPQEMLTNGEPVVALGINALPADARIVHAASHFFFGPAQHRRLAGFADITAILSKTEPPTDGAIRRAAQSVGLESPTYAALAAEAVLTGREAEINGWFEPAGLMRLAYARPKRLRVAEQLYIASTIDGASKRFRYLRQKSLPGNEFLESRGGLVEYARGRTHAR